MEDFDDWTLAGEDKLRAAVIENLQVMYDQIRDGSWRLAYGGEAVIEWRNALEFDSGASSITIAPAEFRDAVVHGLRDLAPVRPEFTAQRAEFIATWQRVLAAWRAALDQIDIEAQGILDRSS